MSQNVRTSLPRKAPNPMRFLNLLFGRLFAVVIMSVLAVVMAIITFVENMRINPPTPFPWYQSWWFYSLLALFCVSICVVMLTRDQFRLRRWPLFAVHFGLVIVLLGGFLSWLGGTRGYLQIERGKTATHFRGESPLLVVENENLRRRVDLGDLEDSEGEVVEGPRGGEYEIAEVLISARSGGDGKMVPDRSGRGHLAVLVRTADGESEAWITREGAAAKLGGAEVRLTWQRPLGFSVTLLEAREERYPASRTPKSYYSWVRIDDPDELASREFIVETNSPLVYKGFRFYQSSMTANRASGFQVTRDPGLVYVTVGICLHFIGMLVLYGRRFVAGPLQRRAQLASPAEAPVAPPPLAPDLEGPLEPPAPQDLDTVDLLETPPRAGPDAGEEATS